MADLNDKSLELLEFSKIRERLAQYASFSGGRELALALRPSPDFETAVRRQQESQEAQALLESRPGFGLGNVREVRPAVEQARLGGILDPQALEEIRETLAGARSARTVIVGSYGRTFPALVEVVRSITPFPALEEEIARCVAPRGEVKESASPLLAQLRQEVRQAHDRLVDRLQHLVHSEHVRPMLQEPLVTLRHGRYVVPVKAEFKGEFRGVVQDVSASGATLFMEPLETLPLGNTWREYQLLEEKEVERILRRLSEGIGQEAPAISQTVEAVARLDLALAKARFGQALHATYPELRALAPAASSAGPSAGAGRLHLIQARHPLLTGHIVPITVDIGGDYHALVITGPNTGGKTVALKTVGLLCVMAQAGMPIPAREGSMLPVFRSIDADIGDEQSIEQSLSTFSSHLGTIISILEEADAACLVLLDELGAGTDPAEGAALAQAILEELLRRRATTIATTHHSELKAFAHTTPGARNASVEFDPETLAPTYHLVIGPPGQSNAIAIAERLGLAQPLVVAARARLGVGHAAVEDLLSDLQQERRAVAADRAAAARLLREAEAAQQETQGHLWEIAADKARRLQQAREQITQELAQLQRRLRQARATLQRLDRLGLEEAARELRTVQEELTGPGWQPAPLPAATAGGPLPLKALQPGVPVLVRGLGQIGEVLAPPTPEGEVEVQVGAFKAKVQAAELEGASGPILPVGPAPGSWDIRLPAIANPGAEVHVRGLTVPEALDKLETYLHDAYLAGLRQVRVVHGKGTGVLRRAVRERLATHPLVQAVAPAEQREGGEGVTIAELVA